MRIASIIFVLMVLASCQQSETTAIKATTITTTTPVQQVFEHIEYTTGTLNSIIDPTLIAEVNAKVAHIQVSTGQWVEKNQVLATLDKSDLEQVVNMHRAEVKRLETQLAHQQRHTERYRQLFDKKLLSPMHWEEAMVQETSLKEQLIAAKAKLTLSQRDVEKTIIRSPLKARLAAIHLSEGSFVTVGTPMFHLVDPNILQASLPLPETLAPFLKPGLIVRLWTPTAPNEKIEHPIKDIKPYTGAQNRSLEILVDVDNHNHWKPGSSVRAEIILATTPDALFVPELSVVLRPTGQVVYVVADNQRVKQQPVTVGAYQHGWVQIIEGLTQDQIIAHQGASFLTDNAPINIKTSDTHS